MHARQLIITATVLGTAYAAFAFLPQQQGTGEEEQQPPPSAESRPHAHEVTETPDRPGRGSQPIRDDIAADSKSSSAAEDSSTAVRDELNALRRRIQWLESQAAYEENYTDTEHLAEYGDPEPVGNGPDDAVNEESDALDQQVLLDAQLESELPDADWTYDLSTSLNDAQENGQLSSISDFNVDCRSSLCRVEIASDKETSLGNIAIELMSIGDDLNEGSAYNTPQGGAVLYLRRGSDDSW